MSNTVSSLSCEPVTKLVQSRGVEEQLAESVVACEIAEYLVALLGSWADSAALSVAISSGME